MVTSPDSGTVPRMQVAAMLDAGALPGASGAAGGGTSGAAGGGTSGAAGGGRQVRRARPPVLGSASTRQYGMVQATDVNPTIASLVLGETLPGTPGVPMERTEAAPSDHLFRLVDISDHSLAIRPLVPGFFSFLVLVNLLL